MLVVKNTKNIGKIRRMKMNNATEIKEIQKEEVKMSSMNDEQKKKYLKVKEEVKVLSDKLQLLEEPAIVTGKQCSFLWGKSEAEYLKIVDNMFDVLLIDDTLAKYFLNRMMDYDKSIMIKRLYVHIEHLLVLIRLANELNSIASTRYAGDKSDKNKLLMRKCSLNKVLLGNRLDILRAHMDEAKKLKRIMDDKKILRSCIHKIRYEFKLWMDQLELLKKEGNIQLKDIFKECKGELEDIQKYAKVKMSSIC
jgi:hypothetical protein